MSLRTSAARYAKVLFDVALAESDPARIEQDLASLISELSGHDELRQLLKASRIPSNVRVNVVRAIAERSGALPPVAKLLTMLAERNRLELLPDILDVYRERLLTHANIVRASVASAAPLAPEKVRALGASLSDLTGKQVQLDVGVDASLIGGVVAKIGSTVYDGSVRTQLQKMKQQLVENA